MFPGAATAPDGIAIDLKLLNGLRLSENRETVFVGTGNRWTNVYGFLDPFNLTAVGGRAGFVGVGGFLLGGELEMGCFTLNLWRLLRSWKVDFGYWYWYTDLFEQGDSHTSPENTDGEPITSVILRYVLTLSLTQIKKLTILPTRSF